MKNKKIGNSIFRFEQEAGIDSKLGNWRRLLHEKHNILNNKKEESRYDFLPVVKINKSENAKNAIISIKECANHKINKISLGNDYDKDKQNYLVADIVIAKNSVVKIPLIIKRGYDPWGFQDEDGILEFKSSNRSIQMDFIDNDDTDYKDNKPKYDLNNAEYGDEFVLEINASALARGTSFTISVYASDDKEEGVFGTSSNRKGICGKFNMKVVEKDVFLTEEIAAFIKENQNSLDNKTKCFIAVDNQFSKMVDDSKLKLKNYSNKTGIDRANDYSKKGYVFSTKKFNQKNIWVRVDKPNYKLFPISFRNGKDTVFTDYIKQTINKKIGYHVYYFTLLNAYHVLSIIVNNSEPCDVQYKILDQIRDRAWRSLKKLDNDILDMTIRNYKSACDIINKNNHNSSVQLWKLQRK